MYGCQIYQWIPPLYLLWCLQGPRIQTLLLSPPRGHLKHDSHPLVPRIRLDVTPVASHRTLVTVFSLCPARCGAATCSSSAFRIRRPPRPPLAHDPEDLPLLLFGHGTLNLRPSIECRVRGLTAFQRLENVWKSCTEATSQRFDRRVPRVEREREREREKSVGSYPLSEPATEVGVVLGGLCRPLRLQPTRRLMVILTYGVWTVV